jgi:DNA invertase Pin-like site-specific DNA recombinase
MSPVNIGGATVKHVRVKVYRRVSSLGQVNGKDFGSLEKQLANAQCVIERRKADGWVYVGEYCDRAITGVDDSREALQDLLADAERREFDVVVFTYMDRLGRMLHIPCRCSSA